MQQPKRISMRRSTSGFVLPTVVFGLVIMSVVSVAALRGSADENRSARALRESGIALYTAEAAMHETIGHWPSSAANALAAGDSLVLGPSNGWQTMPTGSRYRVVIHRVDDNGGVRVYAVIVQGRGVEGSAGDVTVESIVHAVTTNGGWGFFSAGDMVIGGSGSLVDSYNSTLGPYNPTASNSNASVYSGGSIDMNPATIIKGSVTAVGTVEEPDNITGTVSQHSIAQPTYPTLDCPTGGFTPNAWIPQGAGVSYNQSTGLLKIQGGNSLTLSGHNQYYFSQVIVSGGSTLTIDPGSGHVDMYVSDKVVVGGGGVANTSTKPNQLRLAACGTPIKPAGWDLSGGSDGFMTVYAPNQVVTVGGGGNLFGSIIAAEIDVTGGSKLHADESLGGAVTTTLSLISGSWVQLTLY